jgi:hypothetical protein
VSSVGSALIYFVIRTVTLLFFWLKRAFSSFSFFTHAPLSLNKNYHPLHKLDNLLSVVSWEFPERWRVTNVFSLESLVRAQAKSGHLITLSQFLFASSIGLSKHLEFQKHIPYVKFKNRNVPLTSWVLMVILFWLVNVLNNYALGFKIFISRY